MNAMRPDEIQLEMERQRVKDLRGYIFLVIMLVVAPIVFVAMIVASMFGL